MRAKRQVAEADTEKITIRLPSRYLRALEFLVTVDDFPSKSEAIRAAIRDLIYARVDTVVDRLKKLESAEQALSAMEAFEREYLKK